MLAQLKDIETVAVTDLVVPENSVRVQVPKSGEGFKSLIGAYKTDAKMLGWKMPDIITVIKSIFTGAGQPVPTITKQYAGKVNVKPGDGLIIEGGGTHVKRHVVAGGAARRSHRVTEGVACAVMIGITAVMAIINGVRV
jgi:hypothetical protein